MMNHGRRRFFKLCGAGVNTNIVGASLSAVVSAVNRVLERSEA